MSPADLPIGRVEEQLNSAEILPAAAFRRNHRIYELVGYVNCLLGCRIAENAEGEAVFSERIVRYLSDHPAAPDELRYYEVVSSYVGKRG